MENSALRLSFNLDLIKETISFDEKLPVRIGYDLINFVKIKGVPDIHEKVNGMTIFIVF